MVADENNIHVVKSPLWSNENNPVFMSMVVLSAPKHFEERETVRKEFSKLKRNFVKWNRHLRNKTIELTFLLGSVKNGILARHLEEEQETHGDIFQISVLDSYQNLAYKTMTSYLWHSQINAPVDWIVKFDDDVAVDWDNILKNFFNSPNHEGLFCHAVLQNRPTHRPGKHIGAKLLVDDYDAYATEVDTAQPPYCNGWIYILSAESGRQLSLASQVTPLVFIEDFYVTGVLRQRMAMNITNVGKKLPLFDDGWLQCPIFNMFRVEYLESFAFPRDEWPTITFKRTTEFLVDLVVHYIYPDLANRL